MEEGPDLADLLIILAGQAFSSKEKWVISKKKY